MEQVELRRDCEAVQIPSGNRLTLEKGTGAFITQALGGSYTLHVPAYGGLFRISEKDADAIGKEAAAAPPPMASTAEGGDLAQMVWEQLKSCYDPEIPVNIVDLGLVYDMQIAPQPSGGSRVDVKMTLTAPGCGMGHSIAADARRRLLALPGVEDANVELVWDPPWNPQMISPEGRERLGMA
jgi:probable FeS assembly SUF system protein SufT